MGTPTPLRIISRASPLALAQVEEAKQVFLPLLPRGIEIQQQRLDTPGDRDRTTPLTDDAVPDDFFTRDLDEALLSEAADLSVHSAKDLPRVMPPGLVVAALLPSVDIRDALVCRVGSDPDEVPKVIGTSSPRRVEFARRTLAGAQLKPIRGNIQERIEQLDRGDYDGVIIAACALHRLGLAGRITRYLDWDPAPQQGRLALVVRANDALRTLFQKLDVRRVSGLVAMVGCPPESALLSTRALRYIENADVIYHDRLLPDDVLLRIQDRAVPVGKAGGTSSISQNEINRRLLKEAESGKLVVRLQGGDPGIFGHLGEELQFLREWNIRTDVVPALTAAQVAAARSQAPLTHREAGRSITFISAHAGEGQDAIEFPGPDSGNLAVYMPVRNREEIRDRLRKAGWPDDTPIIVAERMGYKDETLWPSTLSQFSEQEMESPAVLLVGPVSYDPPHATLFVGTNPEHFLRYGPLVHWPLIKLVSRPLEERVTAIRQELDLVDGLLFPSRFAVPSFLEALLQVGDARLLAGKKILAVGPSTAGELLDRGLNVDLSCESFRGVRELAERITPDFRGRYLYPCSDAAPQEDRKVALQPHGIELVPAVFYRNREMPFLALPRRPFSRVLFTSSSTVRVYFSRYPEEKEADRTWIAVGPSTLEAIEAEGLSGEEL